MRSFIKSEKKLKITYKILKIIVLIFLGIFAVLLFNDCSVKKMFYPLKYKDEIFAVADCYNLDRALVFAVVKTESGFDENAKSSKGAVGLMQITSATAEYIATMKNENEYDINKADTNLDFGCFYLKYLNEKFQNMDTALSAYNAGEGRVALWLQDEEYSEDGISLKKIPITETAEYVKKINESFDKYKKLYGKLLDK